MADEREEEMLALMRDCQQTIRRCENVLNEIWAEWTRTHGYNIKGHPQSAIPHEQEAPMKRKVVRRS